jgi:hypothetical protein
MQQAILVHGVGRTPVSMLLLADRLRRLGYRVSLFGYFAAIESFTDITRRLTARLAKVARAPYLAVGHSLGGMLLRAAVGALPPGLRRPEHLMLLGSPAGVPRLAVRLQKRWLYQLALGDSGQRLADAGWMAALPRPDVPTTIVAGTAGWYGRWSPFGAEPNDGVVAVAETVLPGARRVELPAVHTLLMNSAAVATLIVQLGRARDVPGVTSCPIPPN